jgi:hypothetical protein
MEEILGAISHTRPNGEKAVYLSDGNLGDMYDALYQHSREFCGPVLLNASLCSYSEDNMQCREMEESLKVAEGGSVSGWWTLKPNPTWPAEYGNTMISVSAYAGEQVNGNWVQWGDVTGGAFNTPIEIGPNSPVFERKFNVMVNEDLVGESVGSDAVRFTATRQVVDAGVTTWRNTASSSVNVTSLPLALSLKGAWGEGMSSVAAPTIDEDGNVVIEIEVAAVNGMDQEVPVGVTMVTRASQTREQCETRASAQPPNPCQAWELVAPWQVVSGQDILGFESDSETTQSMSFTLENTGAGLGSQAPVAVEFHVTGAGKSLVESHVLYFQDGQPAFMN